MKPHFAFALLLLLFLNVNLHAQTADEKWTLEKCINYALQNNLQVQQAGVTAKIAGADNLQSKLNLLPSIDGQASYSDNFGNGLNPQTFSFSQGNSQSLQMSLNANLPLFTGLQQIYNIQRTKYDLLSSKFDFQAAQNNVALSVASGFLQILLDQEIEKVAEKQRDLTKAQKEIMASRIRAGALPETAIYDIESQLGRDEVAIVNAKNATDLGNLALEQMLRIAPDTSFSIYAPEVGVDNLGNLSALNAESVYNYAVLNQPSVKSADAKLQSSIIARKISFGALSPTLIGFAGLSTGWFSEDKKATSYSDVQNVPFEIQGVSGQIAFPFTNYRYSNIPFGDDLSNNFRKAVGVTLDVPLFSKGLKMINIQKAQLQIQLRRLQLETARTQLRQDIETAYANAKAAAESYFANKKSLEGSQKAYSAAESRYKAGLANNFDIQQAKTNLIAAEAELLKAKYTYVLRTKILDFYQGKPITLN